MTPSKKLDTKKTDRQSQKKFDSAYLVKLHTAQLSQHSCYFLPVMSVCDPQNPFSNIYQYSSHNNFHEDWLPNVKQSLSFATRTWPLLS
jgi:hypothetical protein